MLTPAMIQQANAITGRKVSAVPGGAPSRAQEVLDIAAKAKSASTPAPAPSNPIADQFNQGISQVKQAGSEIFSGKENPIQAAESGLKAESGVATAITSPLAPVMKPVGNVINWLGEKIGGTEAAQNFVKQHPEAAATLERLATDASNAGNIAGTIAGAEGVVKGAPKVVDATKNFAENMKTTPEEAAANSAASDAAKIKGIADEWSKPAAENKSSFNKARAVLSKDPAIPQTLAQLKINPFAHVEDGRYNTADTAEALRETAGKMSSDMLRPSLQAADKTTPPVPVDSIVQEAIRRAEVEKGLTEGDRATIINNITKEGKALIAKYGGKINLENAHDSKITYAQNGGYSPIKSAADNNTATANRFLGSAFQQAVEKNSPADLPTKEFNAELQKYYRAADYLDALNTKKAPVSLAQTIAHRGAEVVGAAVGHSIGGGILGGVGGYMIGGALERALENMSGKARGHFITNLKTSNPEAFSKVEDYLKSAPK